MKKITMPFIACLALATSAFAGQEIKESKAVAPEPCFKDQELQIGAFGSYTSTTAANPHADGFGGGIEVNYFFMRYLGVGVDGNIYEGDANGVWDATGRLIARFPIDNGVGGLCIAPYIFAGGGVLTDSILVGTWHVGGGLEYRATQQIGIFAEGRYTWGGEDGEFNAAQARVGVRFVF
jgi:opacity protein-like surface antigen